MVVGQQRYKNKCIYRFSGLLRLLRHRWWKLLRSSSWMNQSHLMRSGLPRARGPLWAETPVCPQLWGTGLTLQTLRLANSWLKQQLLASVWIHLVCCMCAHQWPGTWSKPFTEDLRTTPKPSISWTLMKASSLLERVLSVPSRTWSTEYRVMHTTGFSISFIK